MTDLPAAAITAAAKALERALRSVGTMTTSGNVTWEQLAENALEAAAPHITAGAGADAMSAEWE